MKICNCSAKLAFLAIVAAGLLAVPPEKSQAQELENYAWITNTNGITWKREIDPYGRGNLQFESEFEKSDKPKIASILVPEHAEIDSIDVRGCVNLTNIVIQPARSGWYDGQFEDGTRRFVDKPLTLFAEGSGLRNITAQKTMMNSIVFEFPVSSEFGGPLNRWGQPYARIAAWALTIQWTELFPWDKFEPPKIEIKTHATANGWEVEVVWRESTLQIADSVNGKWRDHIGISPLRFPLAAAKDKQFFRIARIESPTKEEPPTPQTLGGNR